MTIRYNPNDGTGRWYQEYSLEERLEILHSKSLELTWHIETMMSAVDIYKDYEIKNGIRELIIELLQESK